MKTPRRVLLRAGAITFSALLMAGFVHYRATGRVLPGFDKRTQRQMNGTQQLPGPAPQLDLQSSQPATIEPTEYELLPVAEGVMPGSKWAPVVQFDQSESEDREYFVGTNSGVILRPEDLPDAESESPPGDEPADPDAEQ